jgi:hypothetical protein
MTWHLLGDAKSSNGLNSSAVLLAHQSRGSQAVKARLYTLTLLTALVAEAEIKTYQALSAQYAATCLSQCLSR